MFYETLRLRPGVPKNARYLEQDDYLPALPEAGWKEKIKIEKGSYLLWSDLCMMKDKEVSFHYVLILSSCAQLLMVILEIGMGCRCS